MSVVTLYQSDRDLSKTFTDKKDADVYDKKLELAETVGAWMKRRVPDLSDEQAERLGTVVAENKSDLIKALKGRSEVLLESPGTDEHQPESDEEGGAVDIKSAASNE